MGVKVNGIGLTLLVAACFGAGALVMAQQPNDQEDRVTDEEAKPVVLEGPPTGTVPSVFAHTRDSATALLESMDVEVDYEQEISCDPEGRAVGTDPSTGTPIKPGDTVTLLLAYQGPTTDCFSDLSEPWRFVDFATGRGLSPKFASQVELFVDGQPTQTVSRAQAATGDWGEPSALAALRDAASQILQVGEQFRAPSLDVKTGTPPDLVCGIARPESVGDREALSIGISMDTQQRCPVMIALYRTNGEIDAVVTRTARPLPPNSKAAPVPDVVGLNLTDARDAVTSAGFTTQLEETETCHPRQGVVEQAPTQQDIEDDFADDPNWSHVVTLVVEVPHRTQNCAGLDAAADAFIAFARGGPPPPWSTEVQQLFGHELRDNITAERANDRDAWSFCSGVAPSDCTISPLVVASEGEVETAEWSERFICEMVDYGDQPKSVYSNEDHILLFPAIAPDCEDDWSVELWIDEAGHIAAVNLLVSRVAVD